MRMRIAHKLPDETLAKNFLKTCCCLLVCSVHTIRSMAMGPERIDSNEGCNEWCDVTAWFTSFRHCACIGVNASDTYTMETCYRVYEVERWGLCSEMIQRSLNISTSNQTVCSTQQKPASNSSQAQPTSTCSLVSRVPSARLRPFVSISTWIHIVLLASTQKRKENGSPVKVPSQQWAGP